MIFKLQRGIMKIYLILLIYSIQTFSATVIDIEKSIKMHRRDNQYTTYIINEGNNFKYVKPGLKYLFSGKPTLILPNE